MRAALQINERGEITGTILANGPSIVLDENVMEIPWKVYEDWIMVEGQDNFYYDREQVLLKRKEIQTVGLSKVSLTADAVDSITFTSILPNTLISIYGPGSIYNIDNVELLEGETFSTSIPGEYKIKITSWPYRDFETTITAVTP